MKKPLLSVAMLCALLITLSIANLQAATRPAVISEYVELYKDIAIREMLRSGIPASITLAQGLHESGIGNGELAANSNNHFGIKCKDDWTGEKYFIEDDDYKNGKLVKSCFRSYDRVEDSFIDHTNFLMDNSRYSVLFKYDRTDFTNWAKGLKKCGYATDKQYAKKLIEKIKNYGLHEYDVIAQPEELVTFEKPTYEAPTYSNTSADYIDQAYQLMLEMEGTNTEVQTENTYTTTTEPNVYEAPVTQNSVDIEPAQAVMENTIVTTQVDVPVEEQYTPTQENTIAPTSPRPAASYNAPPSMLLEGDYQRTARQESYVPNYSIQSATNTSVKKEEPVSAQLDQISKADVAPAQEMTARQPVKKAPGYRINRNFRSKGMTQQSTTPTVNRRKLQSTGITRR